MVSFLLYLHKSEQKYPVSSVYPSDEKHHEILEKFLSTNYGEKHLSKILAKIPDNVTLTLHEVKIPGENPW